jgi:hypothetical protein
MLGRRFVDGVELGGEWQSYACIIGEDAFNF